MIQTSLPKNEDKSMSCEFKKNNEDLKTLNRYMYT